MFKTPSKLKVELTAFYLNLLTISLAITIPDVAYAQTGTLGDIINEAGNLIGITIPVVVGAAVLGFFWGLTKYIWKAGDKEAQDEGRRIMIAGVVSLFLIVAIGGIVGVLVESFGFVGGQTIPIPGVGTGSG